VNLEILTLSNEKFAAPLSDNPTVPVVFPLSSMSCSVGEVQLANVALCSDINVSALFDFNIEYPLPSPLIITLL